MKRIVILGGGTGLSTLLRGLKLFPVDITAVVSVCDLKNYLIIDLKLLVI